MHEQSNRLLRDQLVRVRTESAIASTLDSDGKLDGLLFTPEMARYCGYTFRVYRRAGKTCVEGHGLRRLKSVVLLEGARCDGAFHDDCQRNCLYFWKEAWLEPVCSSAGEPTEPPHSISDESLPQWANRLATRESDRYICQSTELLGATESLSRWNFTHFLSEIRDGELSIMDFLKILSCTVIDRARRVFGRKPRGVLSGNKEQFRRGDLNLGAGEWVIVKPVPDIRLTLDSEGKNCGLSFEPDMVHFAKGRFQVEFPIRKIISEETGRMVTLANTVALKGVSCAGLCTKNCPRSNTLFWRESWLMRACPPT
jgi:hypothetical protein